MNIKSTQHTTCSGEPPAKHISVRLGGPSTGRTCPICREHYIIFTSNPRPSVSQPGALLQCVLYLHTDQCQHLYQTPHDTKGGFRLLTHTVRSPQAQWLLYVPHSGYYMYHRLQHETSTTVSTAVHIQICIQLKSNRGTRWRSWLRHCATTRKVAGSVPDGVIGIFH